MAGRVGRAELQGKTVIVGTDAERLGDQFMLPAGARPAASIFTSSARRR
jgi:CHASE2 domain-containing sensor protein